MSTLITQECYYSNFVDFEILIMGLDLNHAIQWRLLLQFKQFFTDRQPLLVIDKKPLLVIEKTWISLAL